MVLKIVPPFATAHMLLTSWDGPVKSGFLTVYLLKQRYFCAVCNYVGKADLNKGYWNLKRKFQSS